MRESIEIGGVEVRPGARVTIDLPIAYLSTHTPMTMPVHVVHGRKPGPSLFVSGAIHGDEIAGVEIIRRVLRLGACERVRGTLIAIPIVNVFGFLNQSRYLPDRRDLNRSFPGSAQGSLTARLAHLFLTEIVSKCTHGIDLHTGSHRRMNFPQVRADIDDAETKRLASVFGVPIVINARLREGSLRAAAAKQDVPVLVYEAGEELRFDETCIRAGVQGVVRVMRELGMIHSSKGTRPAIQPLLLRSSRWMRAPASGVFRASTPGGVAVRAGDGLGFISDPFGENEVEVVSSEDGVVIGHSTLPLVNEGDALFHIGLTEGTQATEEMLDAFEPDETYAKGATAALADEPPLV